MAQRGSVPHVIENVALALGKRAVLIDKGLKSRRIHEIGGQNRATEARPHEIVRVGIAFPLQVPQKGPPFKIVSCECDWVRDPHGDTKVFHLG